MARTTREIFMRMGAVEDVDWIGTQRGDLLNYLRFEDAREFLKDTATEEKWAELGFPRPRDEESIKAEILEYMPFAWGKANNCRGLSAGRSLDHMSVWLWMLGRDEAAKQVLKYDRYGKGRLRTICEEFGWDWKQWDDGSWKNSEDDYGVPPPKTVESLY